MMRMCSMCRIPKDETEFRFMRRKNRRNSYCKDCERVYQLNYQRARRELNGGGEHNVCNEV